MTVAISSRPRIAAEPLEAKFSPVDMTLPFKLRSQRMSPRRLKPSKASCLICRIATEKKRRIQRTSHSVGKTVRKAKAFQHTNFRRIGHMKLSQSCLLRLVAFLVCIQPWGALGQGSKDEGGLVTETKTVTHSTASATASASASTTTVTHTTTRSSPSVSTVSETHPAEPPVSKSRPSADNRNVTERIRDAVLNAEVEEISKLLKDVDDVPGLALGFTFPESRRDEYLFETNIRITDPDVVALKGMATAAVKYEIACKLADVFIGAIYGLDFDNKLCPEEAKSLATVSKNRTVIKTSFKRITNSSGTFTIHAEPKVKTKHWEGSYNADDFEFDFEAEAEASYPAEDSSSQIPECFTKEEMKRIRKRLRKDFSDLELMTQIVEGRPKLQESQRRSLLVIGTPVHSWCCASCWKERFCNKNAWWCPSE